MSPEELRDRADKARILASDETLGEAVNGMYQEALTQLATVDPTDADAIRALQAQARASTEFVEKLKAFIAAKPQERPKGVA